MYDLITYKRGSRSASILSRLVGCRLYSAESFASLQQRLVRKAFRYTRRVINWGSSDSFLLNYNVINRPDKVAIATNKLKTFEVLRLAGVSIPIYFKGVRGEALLANPNEVIYARHLTRASGGRGITVVQPGSPIPYAPLYTVGIPCKREYRVHVFNGAMIDLVAKCKRNGDSDVGDYIHNHSLGYIFTRNSVRIPDDVRANLSALAISAVTALGLDFGAVDIIRSTEGQLYVLEVNTAPGIEGTTLEAYVNAFKNYDE